MPTKLIALESVFSSSNGEGALTRMLDHWGIDGIVSSHLPLHENLPRAPFDMPHPSRVFGAIANLAHSVDRIRQLLHATKPKFLFIGGYIDRAWADMPTVQVARYAQYVASVVGDLAPAHTFLLDGEFQDTGNFGDMSEAWEFRERRAVYTLRRSLQPERYTLVNYSELDPGIVRRALDHGPDGHPAEREWLLQFLAPAGVTAADLQWRGI